MRGARSVLARLGLLTQLAPAQVDPPRRKAFSPEAPASPLALKAGGSPSAMTDLIRVRPAQMEALANEGIHPHHGAANSADGFLPSSLHARMLLSSSRRRSSARRVPSLEL